MSTIKKTKLVLAIFLMGFVTVNAQSIESITNDIEFGVKGGVNLAKLKNADGKSRIGFVAGFFAEYHLSDRFSLRSEVLFSVQGAKGNSEKIKLNYISFLPALAKFYPTEKFSIEAGPQLSYLLSKKGGVLLKKEYKKLDYGLALGIAYHISEDLEIGARYYLGLKDITKTTGTIKNAVFQVTFSYGF